MLVEMANFLSACPEFCDKKLCVNYLDKSEDSVAVRVSGSQDGLKEYADGGVMHKVLFTLSIRNLFGVSYPESNDTAALCERVEKWICEQNQIGNLPELGGNQKVVSLKVLKRFEIVSTKDFLARYEAEIELIYYNPA